MNDVDSIERYFKIEDNLDKQSNIILSNAHMATKLFVKARYSNIDCKNPIKKRALAAL